jgi:hypothetical protein
MASSILSSQPQTLPRTAHFSRRFTYASYRDTYGPLWLLPFSSDLRVFLKICMDDWAHLSYHVSYVCRGRQMKAVSRPDFTPAALL